jgi:hypothetical protein
MSATATPINTSKAPRRELSFHCTGCLKEDLAKIEAADRAGTLRVTGNWTAGENLDHVAKTIEFSIDGFPPEVRIAWPVRMIARLMKGRMTSGKTLPAGFKIPQNASYMMPRSGCSFEDGLARLRTVLDRLDRSPLTPHHDTTVALGDADRERGSMAPFGRVDVHGVDVFDDRAHDEADELVRRDAFSAHGQAQAPVRAWRRSRLATVSLVCAPTPCQ